MSAIKKHSFEAVSLLTVKNGVLDVSIIPAKNQPNWVVPSSLIKHSAEQKEHIWTYLWQDQEVVVYHLAARNDALDTIVVLEGNTDVHRLALQTCGDITHKQVRISDVKDVSLPEDLRARLMAELPNVLGGHEEMKLDYIYQAVRIDGDLYIVPDIDFITHRLVDLDS